MNSLLAVVVYCLCPTSSEGRDRTASNFISNLKLIEDHPLYQQGNNGSSRQLLKNSISQYLVDRILSCARVEVLLLTEVVALHGDEILRAITLLDKQTGKEWTEETNWLFLCLGGVRIRNGQQKSAFSVTKQVI